MIEVKLKFFNSQKPNLDFSNQTKLVSISEYIRTTSLIYNCSRDFVSIIDNKNNLLYSSDAMQKLWGDKTAYTLYSIEDFNYSSVKIINEFITLNNKIFHSGQTLKYFYLLQTNLFEDVLLKGTKYPIYENDKVIAILTIEQEFKLINLEDLDDDRNHYFEVPDYKLTNIENLILFYTSFGFSHGETYQFILKHNEIKLSFDNYKYYWKQLLRIFHASTMKELIENNYVLKSRRFIPQKLLKNKIFLLSSSLN